MLMSQKTKTIRSWHVQAVTDFMLRSWAAKVTANLGGKVLGKWTKDRDRANEDYTDVPMRELPTWDGGSTSTATVSRGMLARGIMTLHDAELVLSEAAERCLLQFDAETRAQAKRKNRVDRKGVKWKRGYRAWQSVVDARRIMEREKQYAFAELELRRMTKHPRKGVQRVSTFRTYGVPVGRSFRFNGLAAHRMPRGRPPLPEAVWRSRYMARLENRRRNNTTKIRRTRGIVRVPPTKSLRPLSEPTLGPKAKPWEL